MIEQWTQGLNLKGLLPRWAEELLGRRKETGVLKSEVSDLLNQLRSCEPVWEKNQKKGIGWSFPDNVRPTLTKTFPALAEAYSQKYPLLTAIGAIFPSGTDPEVNIEITLKYSVYSESWLVVYLFWNDRTKSTECKTALLGDFPTLTARGLGDELLRLRTIKQAVSMLLKISSDKRGAIPPPSQ